MLPLEEIANSRGKWLRKLNHKEVGKVNLREMAPPSAIAKIHPDQVVEDILMSTLLKVQSQASPEISAAAARFVELIREKSI